MTEKFDRLNLQNLKTPSKLRKHPTKKMTAGVYRGKKSIVYEDVPMPTVTDPTDAVIRITMAAVCGSDLHLYHGELPNKYVDGYIFGHEAVGIVEDIGVEVKKFKKGDKVIISAVISCGMCEYCQRGEMSCCDVTNKSTDQSKMYGHCTGGILGYSELVGGYDGCQAEFVRVPYADVNLFTQPGKVEDRLAVLVSDILCTGYHGNELADVKEGDNVVIFGCGPVGLMTQMWARYRKANIVVAIDVDQQRLDFALKHWAHRVINSSKEDPVKAVVNMIPGGPDKVIDCVGFRFPDSLLHKIERAIGIESDAPNVVNSAIMMCRKNGRIALIGDYFGFVNHFNIGALMEKHLTMNGGQLWPHRYQKKILELLESGEIDPSPVITHTYPLSRIDEAYKHFDKHDSGHIKTLVVPDTYFNMIKQEKINQINQ